MRLTRLCEAGPRRNGRALQFRFSVRGSFAGRKATPLLPREASACVATPITTAFKLQKKR